MFTRSFWPYLDIINLAGPHFWFFPKGLAYDFGSKFPISLKFVSSQIRPGNDVCWIFRVKSKWFWPYMSMSNLSSLHTGFLPNGLAYDFRSKFKVSSKFVYGQIGPENDVWWCFKVKSKWFWPDMRMSNLSSRNLGSFPKGLAFDFWSKFQISFKFVYGQIERL